MGTQASQKTPGRNDPCPCGSGKKYKKCCATRKASISVNAKNTLEYGFSLYHQGDLPGAMSIASDLIKSYPDMPEAYALRGACYLSQNKAEMSREDFLRVLELKTLLQDENYLSGVRLGLSTIELKMGNPEKAGGYAQEAIDSGFNNVLTQNALGTAMAAQDKFGEAKDAFHKAIGFDSSDPELWENMGHCHYYLFEYSDARQCYEKALNLDSGRIPAHRSLGATLLAQAKYSNALDHLLLAYQENKKDGDITTDLGTAYMYLGQLAEARRWFDKSLELNAFDARAYNFLGHLYLEKGEITESRKMFDKAISIEPENGVLLFAAAKAMESLNLNDEARSLVEKINGLNLSRDDVSLLKAKILLSRLYYRDKRTSEALQLLQDLEPFIHSRADVLYTYYFELGYQLDKAKAYDDAFLAFKKGNKEKQSARELSFSNEEYRKENEFLEHLFTEKVPSGNKENLRVNENSRHPSPIFIVGFPRSGTTLLEQIIGSHANIDAGGELGAMAHIQANLGKYVNSSEKFPEVLLELEKADPGLQEKLQSAYFNSVSNQANIDPGKSLFTDKMPDNLRHIGFINFVFPGSPIVHIRRHPLSACLSAFMTDFRQGHEYSLDLKTTAECYVAQMELVKHYREKLKLNYLEIRYEDLVQDSEPVTRRILEFIGVDWDPACLEFYKSKRIARTASYEQVTNKIYTDSLMRHKNYEKHLSEAETILKSFISEHERMGNSR